MRKKCGHTYKCNCAGDILSINPCSTTPECENEEVCSEITNGKCVVYTGNSLLDSNGQGIIIPNGMNANDAIQKLLSYILNPGCNSPGAPCQAPNSLKSTKITQTTAKFSWGSILNADNYVVEYKVAGTSSWSVNPPVTTLLDTIGGLTANTNYYIRVSANCGVDTCYSVIILIKTKP